MRYYLTSHKKEHHLESSPPATTNFTYDVWWQSNIVVLATLLQRNIGSIVMFLTLKEVVWDSLAHLSFLAKYQNISHVYLLYEELFSLKQDGRPLQECYISIKGKWDELN